MRKLMKLPNKANDDNSPTAPHQPSTSPTTPATTPTDHPSKVTHRPVGGSTHDILYTTNVSNKQLVGLLEVVVAWWVGDRDAETRNGGCWANEWVF